MFKKEITCKLSGSAFIKRYSKGDLRVMKESICIDSSTLFLLSIYV